MTHLRVPLDGNDISAIEISEELSQVAESLLKQADIDLHRLEAHQQLLGNALAPPLLHHICQPETHCKNALTSCTAA